MAKPQPHSQRVVFGTSTQNPIIIQYAERGVTRSLSLAAPLTPGEFMVKKSGGKTSTKGAPKTPAPEPDKGGRPIVHTEDVYDEILRRHCEGETITSICRDAGMPTLGTVSRKAADDPMFGKRLTRAKEQFADAVFDEALEIADATGKERKDPPLLPNGKIDLMAVKADVHRDRLRIDTRMRIAAKANPAKYSDRINVNHSGGISLEGVDDGQLNVKLERRLFELGVFELMDRHKVPAAFREEFLGLFRVVELPTSVPAPRALPGEDPEELEL